MLNIIKGSIHARWMGANLIEVPARLARAEPVLTHRDKTQHEPAEQTARIHAAGLPRPIGTRFASSAVGLRSPAVCIEV